MLPAKMTQNLTASALKPLKAANGLGKRVRASFSQASDSITFTGSKAADLPKKDFWATVNRCAFGKKYASKWRKALGWLKYPYSLTKHAILWIFGQRQGFKNVHPLGKESRSQIMERIEALNGQVKAPDLRFQFSKAEVEAAGIHKNHLLKAHDSLLGLTRLQKATDWNSTAVSLEQFLSANGKNNGKSCANVSATHAAKLSSGAPMKRVKLKGEAAVFGASQEELKAGMFGQNLCAEKGPDTVMLPTPAYKAEFHAATDSRKLTLVQESERNMVKQFGIQDRIHPVDTAEELAARLMTQKDGAQALVFDWKRGGEAGLGHVTLLAKIRGDLYHIDNLEQKSAQVRRFSDWLTQHRPEKLWYGLLKEEVHPAIAGA